MLIRALDTEQPKLCPQAAGLHRQSLCQPKSTVPEAVLRDCKIAFVPLDSGQHARKSFRATDLARAQAAKTCSSPKCRRRARLISPPTNKEGRGILTRAANAVCQIPEPANGRPDPQFPHAVGRAFSAR